MKNKKITVLVVSLLLIFLILLMCVAAIVISFNPAHTVFDIRKSFKDCRSESQAKLAVLDDSTLILNPSGTKIAEDVDLNADDCLLVSGSKLYYVHQSYHEDACGNSNCKSHIYLSIRDFTADGDDTKYDLGCFSKRYKSLPRVRSDDEATTAFLFGQHIYVTDFDRVITVDITNFQITEIEESENDLRSKICDFEIKFDDRMISVTSLATDETRIIDEEYILNNSGVGGKVLGYFGDEDALFCSDYYYSIESKIYFYMMPVDVWGNCYPTLFEYDYISDDVSYVYMCSPNGFLLPSQKCVILHEQ